MRKFSPHRGATVEPTILIQRILSIAKNFGLWIVLVYWKFEILESTISRPSRCILNDMYSLIYSASFFFSNLMLYLPICSSFVSSAKLNLTIVFCRRLGTVWNRIFPKVWCHSCYLHFANNESTEFFFL